MMGKLRRRCLLAVSFFLNAPLASASAQIDPDAGDEAPASPRGAVAGSLDPDCDAIGFFGSPFSGQTRYRGNAYRFEFSAVLKEIKMELAFSGPAELHVAIHQKQPDGSYVRYLNLPDVVIPQAAGLGAGVPHFYSTADAIPPMEPVTIEEGFEYAIAFAWGSKTITYGRDQQGYPVPFRSGQVLGLVAVNNLPPPPDPLIPEIFVFLDIFTTGAYSMELCFEPQPGACCSTVESRCITALKTECVGPGSFFYGEHTLCAETPCIFGACCTRCGECFPDYTEGGCFAEDGANHWPGVSCPAIPSDLCPTVTGACCRTNGSCDEVCELLCNGVYHGDGTTCTPNPCKGACCIPNLGCSDRTQASCTTFGGQFRQLGTTCATLSGANECGGACCFGDGALTGCRLVGQRALCAHDDVLETAYRGDTSTCANCGAVSDYRACCLPDGTCINTPSTTPATCTGVGVYGEFDPVNSCAALPDGCSVKACCLPDGECSNLTLTACTNFGGSRPGVGVCGVSTCATGACCFTDDGLCTQRTAAACASAGGNYRGNGTNCGTPALICPGIGACCESNGDCFDDLTSAQCTTIGGDYQNDASVCDGQTVHCDQRRACCATTGLCLLVTEDQCNGIGGEFTSAVSCAAGTCPAGACCLPGGCETRTPPGCLASDGSFQGIDIECSPDLCILGACCNAGTCSRETRFTCERDLGVFKGDNTTCDGPNPCPCTENAECDDGNACTLNDRCEQGVCVNDWHKGAAEYAQLALCLGGPNADILPGCICFDLNADNHVDLRDVAEFFLAFESP